MISPNELDILITPNFFHLVYSNIFHLSMMIRQYSSFCSSLKKEDLINCCKCDIYSIEERGRLLLLDSTSKVRMIFQNRPVSVSVF